MRAFFRNLHINTLLRSLLILVASAAAWSCADDLIRTPVEIPDDGMLHMSVAFEPLCGIETVSRTPGDAIKNLECLTILFYDLEGDLAFPPVTQWGQKEGDGDNNIVGWVLNKTGNSDSPTKKPDDTPTEGVSQAEDNTALATFRLQDIPYGKYKIYAVANMPDLTRNEDTKEKIKTESGLKSIELTWDDDVANDNQMFGYFSKQLNDENAYSKPGDFDAPEITIGQSTPKLYAWVRRAASKVTIAYDGSDLEDDVWVYINKVTIRDIPKTCLLGEINAPNSSEDLIKEGGTLYYGLNGVVPADQASEDYKQWLTLTNDDQEPIGSDHSETAEALFFYENMQGDYEKQDPSLSETELKKYDKRWSNSPAHGVLVDPGDDDYKDEVEFGTYIEVEAFYRSDNPKNITSGKIIYRFMLGKDVTYNYNAERNHHFKLTLVFHGWANQADWHIEYTEDDPAIQTPPFFYMPYLYNQKAMFPFKLNGTVESLNIEIIENGWSPVTRDTHEPPAQTIEDFTWNAPALAKFPPWEGKRDGVQGFPQLGFLALAVPSNTKAPDKNVVNMDYKEQETATDALDGLYRESIDTGDGQECSQQKRYYNVNLSGSHSSGNNEYFITPADQGQAISVQVPLWTRNKTMIENSGYSGNNPYEEFERMAVIKITAKFKEKDRPLEKEVPIYQVRRLVNPKGIWRLSTNNDEFFVHVMTKNSPKDTKYSPYTSDGSWDASIESGAKGFCYLTTNKTATSGTDIIKGKTGSEIKFYIKFKPGATVTGISNGCVININYNGGSCTHKILVRQGYNEDVPIVGTSPLWSAYNLFSCETGKDNQSFNVVSAESTVNPLAVGSLFKRRQYSNGILIENNNTYGPLVPLYGGKLKVAQKNNQGEWLEKTWSGIVANQTGDQPVDGSGNRYKWASFSIKQPGSDISRTYRVPTYDEFKALDGAEYAIGIVYADGATTTDEYFSAYGFSDPNNDNNNFEGSTKGVRGFIVYNAATGNQILFPVGEFGMARRTQFNLGKFDGYESNDEANPRRGFLRYSDVSEPLTGDANLWRPIPYNMPHCPGSIYWIDYPRLDGHSPGNTCGGWDMNYFSLDFSPYTYNNRYDACPIKLVRDN